MSYYSSPALLRKFIINRYFSGFRFKCYFIAVHIFFEIRQNPLYDFLRGFIITIWQHHYILFIAVSGSYISHSKIPRQYLLEFRTGSLPIILYPDRVFLQFPLIYLYSQKQHILCIVGPQHPSGFQPVYLPKYCILAEKTPFGSSS